MLYEVITLEFRLLKQCRADGQPQRQAGGQGLDQPAVAGAHAQDLHTEIAAQHPGVLRLGWIHSGDIRNNFV